MKPTNRLAEVMAEMDAEAAPKPKPGPMAVDHISFLVMVDGRLADFEVRITPWEPKPDAEAGWFPATKVTAGWLSARVR